MYNGKEPIDFDEIYVEGKREAFKTEAEEEGMTYEEILREVYGIMMNDITQENESQILIVEKGVLKDDLSFDSSACRTADTYNAFIALKSGKYAAILYTPIGVKTFLIEIEIDPQYTITYIIDGNEQEQSKYRGQDVNLLNYPYRRGDDKVIAGWTTEEGSEEVEYEFCDSYRADENLTLYPVWKDGYYINYDLQGGTYEVNGITQSEFSRQKVE